MVGHQEKFNIIVFEVYMHFVFQTVWHHAYLLLREWLLDPKTVDYTRHIVGTILNVWKISSTKIMMKLRIYNCNWIECSVDIPVDICANLDILVCTTTCLDDAFLLWNGQ